MIVVDEVNLGDMKADLVEFILRFYNYFYTACKINKLELTASRLNQHENLLINE